MTYSGTTTHAVIPGAYSSADHRHNILTAQEFIAQGTGAAQVLSISKAVAGYGDHALARRVRNVAFEVAAISGERFRYIAPRYTGSRHSAPRRAVNDNRAVRYGQQVAA